MGSKAPKTVAVIPKTTPKKGSVSDTNTKQMAMGSWTPRHLRNKR